MIFNEIIKPIKPGVGLELCGNALGPSFDNNGEPERAGKKAAMGTQMTE